MRNTATIILLAYQQHCTLDPSVVPHAPNIVPLLLPYGGASERETVITDKLLEKAYNHVRTTEDGLETAVNSGEGGSLSDYGAAQIQITASYAAIADLGGIPEAERIYYPPEEAPDWAEAATERWNERQQRTRSRALTEAVHGPRKSYL